MLDEATLTNIRDTFALSKGTALPMRWAGNDKRLWLIPSEVIEGGDNASLLIAFEGYGSALVNVNQPLTASRLVLFGFPATIAAEVVRLLIALFPQHNRLLASQSTGQQPTQTQTTKTEQ